MAPTATRPCSCCPRSHPTSPRRRRRGALSGSGSRLPRWPASVRWHQRPELSAPSISRWTPECTAWVPRPKSSRRSARPSERQGPGCASKECGRISPSRTPRTIRSQQSSWPVSTAPWLRCGETASPPASYTRPIRPGCWPTPMPGTTWSGSASPSTASLPRRSLRAPSNSSPRSDWRRGWTAVRTVAPGESVSYGRRWWADEPTRVATVAIGYADGIRRDSGSAGVEVLVRGRRCPHRGRSDDGSADGCP